jgi:hypothetical protein
MSYVTCFLRTFVLRKDTIFRFQTPFFLEIYAI